MYLRLKNIDTKVFALLQIAYEGWLVILSPVAADNAPFIRSTATSLTAKIIAVAPLLFSGAKN